MIRKIIKINEEKCNGCGICVEACHEGAIELINGKANLLIAADCTAYAYGNFHKEFIRNHITLIGCPKLDEGDYTEKLTAILENNNIKSVVVVRMEVPCCGGIENAVKNALRTSGKFIPRRVVTISTDGRVIE